MNSRSERLLAGCIPISFDGTSILMITSKSNPDYLVIPKGGVEGEETVLEAALRETFEEAGVTGHVRSGPITINDVSWFELVVTQEFPQWPELTMRQRKWFKIRDLLDDTGLIGDRFKQVIEYISGKYSK
jgi:diphosphoinositol-polyphosphate diphosphatase